MKRVLLASTAIVGASLIAAPAFAGTPVVGDNYEVSISGNLRVSFVAANPDVETPALPGTADAAPTNRGYSLKADDSGVAFGASATMDNGIQYGFNLALQTQTSNTVNSDETWGFVDGFFGRIEMGDQDDAGDRIFIGGEDRTAGRGGWDGAPFDLVVTGAAKTGIGPSSTGDATKVIYFTPRFSGFQAGVSITPDSGQDGGAAPSDVGPGFEGVVSIGGNYTGSFSGASVSVSGTYEHGDAEAPLTNDSTVYGFGGSVDYMGFGVAAGYVDSGDGGLATGSTADLGWGVSVGANYSTGPWKVGLSYLHAEIDAGGTTPDPDTDIISVGGNYAVAPGLGLAVDANFFSLENALTTTTANDTDQDGQSYVLSVIFGF